MNPKLEGNVEFLFRRTLEDLPQWAIFVPILFALAIALLVAAFRPSGRLRSLVWGLVVVGLGAALYLPVAFLLEPAFSWWVVLVPVFTIALFYVGMMYLKDARSIHPLWASVLGLLRFAVYTLLAAVFLLPGCQYFEEVVAFPKILFLFDVSASMAKQDFEPGKDPTTLPTRQDRVLSFLTSGKKPDGSPDLSFLDNVAGKMQVMGYRFGSSLDEVGTLKIPQGGKVAKDDLAPWLKPLKDNIKIPEGLDAKAAAEFRTKREDLIEALTSGTNVSGSALQALKLENNSYLQYVVVFSDGQNNAGSDETLREFLARANAKSRTIPIITVGVGEDRQPANIRVEEVLAPEVAQPDDKFPIKVPVIGQGLVDEEFEVSLDLVRIKNGSGDPVAGEKVHVIGPKKGKFKGAGDNPIDTVEFDIDVQDLKQIKSADDANGDLEGTWKVVARVPRHAREAYPNPEHKSEPIEVLVQKRKLRVLLFAGGPTREYQFVRTLLFRESVHKRVDLTVLLQTAKEENIDQDVEKDRFLTSFPNRLGEEDPSQKYMSLNEHDVVICIDPDWSLLTPQQLGLLKEWVNTHGGGVVFVAGPVNSYQVARQGGLDLAALKTIFPVELEDSRLHGLSVGGIGHNTSRPYLLHFTPVAKNFDFLKLDEEGESPTAGWERFFWSSSTPPEGAKDVIPKRGFYNYYPVKSLRPDSTVIATFDGPENSRINNGKDPQPFIVSMRYGAGKTVYLSAGEFWRLRQVKDGFHERFWIKLARHVSGGSSPQKRFGSIWLPRTAAAGAIPFEARIRGSNMLPLPKDARPVAIVKKLGEEAVKPELVDLKPKAGDGDWTGIFTGTVKLREAGEYDFRIPITGTNQFLVQRLTVRKPNPETDNARINFDYLRTMASEASTVLVRLDAASRANLEKRLKAPVSTEGADDKTSPRLFFTLDQAGLIAECIRETQPKRDNVKGPLIDLWDKGFESGRTVDLFAVLCAGIALLSLFAGAILYVQGHKSMGPAIAVGGVIASGLLAALLYFSAWENPPIAEFSVSFVLTAAVILLGTEWLLRKLLKLA